MPDYVGWGYWNANLSGTSDASSYWWDATSATTAATNWVYAPGDWVYQGTSNSTEPVQAGQRIAPVAAEQEQERWRAQERERAKAEERAEQLLIESLSEPQRVMYQQAKKILVRGGESGELYEIRKGRARNIRVLDEQGLAKRTLCAHPREDVPDCDTMLAQKLMLESAEREFLQIANVS